MHAVGDIVTLNRAVNATQVGGGGYNPRRTFPEGATAVVTRVGTWSSILRNPDLGWSAWVRNDAFGDPDPNAPRPRRLGEVPEGEAGIDYIAPDDPRLKWLWDDTSAYATQTNLCDQYDRFTEKFGIPGRPRPFRVAIPLGSVIVTATVTATSQKEAELMVRAQLTDALSKEPVVAPA